MSHAKGAKKPVVCTPVAIAAAALVLLGLSLARADVQDLSKQLRSEVTVTLKLIQAYVTNNDGKPVKDLTAANFEVTDNGKPVPITHFEKHIVGGDEIASPAPAQQAPQGTAPPRLSRKFFLFFDFAFIDQRSARKAREAGLLFIDNEVKPGDELGLLSFSAMRGLTIHEYLTTDVPRIRQIVDGFGTRSIVGRAESLTNFIYADELAHMSEDRNLADSLLGRTPSTDEFFASQTMLQGGGVVDPARRATYIDQALRFAEMFENLARALRYVPGWKNIILFSGGIARSLIYGNRNLVAPTIDASNPDATLNSMRQFDEAHSDTGVRTKFTDALKELKTANTPIYAIDCSRPQGEMDIENPVATSTGARDLLGKDSLIQLAKETGGKYFANTMEARVALSEIEDVTSAYYVLGYSVPSAWDGKFHKIKVAVNRKDCRVSSQNGYYNPKPFNDLSQFEKLLQITDLALSEVPETQAAPELAMAALPLESGGRMIMAAFVKLPGDSAERIIEGGAEAFLLISDELQGKTSVKNFRLKSPDAPKDAYFPVFFIAADPGRYTCRMVLQNKKTGMGARGSTSLIIPPFKEAAVRLDPPLMLEVNAKGGDIGATEEATLHKVYGYDPASYAPRPGDYAEGTTKILAALRCRLADSGVELGISASIENHAAPGRANVPVSVINQHGAGQIRTYLLELAPEALKAGNYTLTITAAGKDGAAAASTETMLTVK
ncbi:MAG: VWA domain-containing protein [Candidatus Aminicenantales bacterium]